MKLILTEEENKMKTVTRIEMADDNNIYGLSFGAELTIKPDGDGFSTLEDGVENNYFSSEEQAQQANIEALVDDHLIVKGYGIHAGRKFWQLPDSIKEEIINQAMK